MVMDYISWEIFIIEVLQLVKLRTLQLADKILNTLVEQVAVEYGKPKAIVCWSSAYNIWMIQKTDWRWNLQIVRYLNDILTPEKSSVTSQAWSEAPISLQHSAGN